ncbi:MAG: hypothetical protein ACRDRP_22285 [Pseudonocardiaceae bacterium]
MGIRRVLTEDLDDERADAATDRRAQERRVQTLKGERQKLLDGYCAGAIPLHMLKSESKTGSGEVWLSFATAEDRLAKLATKFYSDEEVIPGRSPGLTSCTQAVVQPSRPHKQVLSGLTGWCGDGTDQEGEELAEAADEAAGLAKLISVKPTGNDRRPGRRARAHRRRSVDQGWNVKRLVEVTQLLSNPDHPASILIDSV